MSKSVQRRGSWAEVRAAIKNGQKSTTRLKSGGQSEGIVAVLPDGGAGEKALEALEQAAGSVSNIQRIPFEKLDFGDLKALDEFYSAPVVVVDVTERQYEACLYYHIGLRLSFGMKHNVVLYVDQAPGSCNAVSSSGSMTTNVEVSHVNSGRRNEWI